VVVAGRREEEARDTVAVIHARALRAAINVSVSP
jgi:hypothetical protein